MVCSDCGTTWYSRIADLILANRLIAHCARCGGELIAPETTAASDLARDAKTGVS